jgi:predicted CXXCH cytochrome family protein
MGKDKFVHGPAATGDCRFCHKQPKPDRHQFQAISDVRALCYECHEPLELGSTLHQPVEDGDCTGCHDPHQSANRYQLKGAGAELCFTCHDKDIAGGKFVHGPVSEGCTLCHSPHSSDAPKMLMAEGNEVCYSCHSDKQEEFSAKAHLHAPVEEGCVECHNPHSSNFQFSLAAESTKGVCFTCHSDKEGEIAKARKKHAGLDTPRGCIACHDPHASAYSQQLDKAPMDLCLSCHDKEYTHPDGTSVADMKKILDNNDSHHGPIADKDCSGCHNTHGSANFRILRGYFPEKFYAAYNPENFALCFMCHNDTLVKDAVTTTLTNFRNGDQNLHFVHVNKRPKGRTCRACHDAHATSNPKHIRNSVPFGAYQLPIGFTKTKNGGGCLPGCHQEFKYDLNNKVKNR